MRTTLTLDDELVRRLKEEAARRGMAFKDLVNEVIARGLTAPDSPAAEKPFRVKAKACGFRAGIDLRKLNQLVDELEIERAAILAIRDPW